MMKLIANQKALEAYRICKVKEAFPSKDRASITYVK